MHAFTRSSVVTALLSAACFLPAANAEEIRIATYNIEHFADRFDARGVVQWAKSMPRSEELTNMVTQERNQDNEDNWEIAQTILDPRLNPDIVFIQEGCGQEDLEYFNKRWLKDAYKTVTVFPSNSGRKQELCMMLKPGFEVLETRADYYKEKDTVSKAFLATAAAGDDPADVSPAVKENRLFARGPAFVKIKSPGGYVFWAGTNHNKSKSGNSLDVTKWRNREAAREHEIIVDLAKNGDDVVFGGDLNDELGFQEFEQQAGGDSIAKIVGTDGKVVLATKALAEKGAISFGGYYNDRFRSFIDHMFVSAGMAGRVKSVDVFREGFAPVASDHYPVLMVIESK
ncbi:MAG TPA: endonuclease/exonuclease/phosphatase family protein [Tepidisphaeraceae bacterium]|jgi:hypothetical protein